MLLKECGAAWPPNITIGDASANPVIPPKADLGDVVLNAEIQGPGELRIRLCSSPYGVTYTILLPVPSSMERRIIFDIDRKKNTTLSDIGEITHFLKSFRMPTGRPARSQSPANCGVSVPAPTNTAVGEPQI